MKIDITAESPNGKQLRSFRLYDQYDHKKQKWEHKQHKKRFGFCVLLCVFCDLSDMLEHLA